MHLVLMVSGDRVIHVKAFRSFGLATFHADALVMDQIGVGNDMPDWEDSDYRNVFTAPNGISIMIEPCDEPEKMDERFVSVSQVRSKSAMSNISVGDRIRWKPCGQKQGLIGHEGTVLQLSAAAMWAWIRYDDGTEKDAYISELETIES